jgi:hypothetical protein
MDLPRSALPTGPAPAAWVPVDACTLPTAEQPLRVAEFDALFAASLRTIEQPSATPARARLVLAGDEDLAARVQRLVDAETACCSFFTLAVTPLTLAVTPLTLAVTPLALAVTPLAADEARVAGQTVVALDIEVPPARADVLGALVERARRARQAAA